MQEKLYENVLEQSLHTIRRNIPLFSSTRPKIGRDAYVYETATTPFWTDGFWSGELWLAYSQTSATLFRDAGLEQLTYFEDGLEGRLPGWKERTGHDLGLLCMLSAVPAYRLTHNRSAKEAAFKAAYLLDTIPHYKDSSAAAISSAGLLLLTDLMGTSEEATPYSDAAYAILKSLIQNYRAPEGSQGLLLHGSSNVNAFLRSGSRQFADAMLPYGDYFFLEALLRALHRQVIVWS